MTSLVPASRLLRAFAAVALPASALAAIPAFSAAAYAALALFAAVCAADALLGARRLRGMAISAPPVTRLWKDRESGFEATIRNPSRARSIALAIPFPREIVSRPAQIDAALPPDAEYSSVRWTCTGTRRGRYTADRCFVETASALKLWTARRELPLKLELRVYPNLAAEKRASPEFFRRGDLGVHARRQVGKGREFEKLREYAPGDSFDEIDWKATARRGHPITRVFQAEKTQEVYIVLDASRLSGRPAAAGSDASILERNVSAALLLALAAEKQGDRFGLIAFSDSIHAFVRARAGKAHYAACQEALYALQPRLATPAFDEVCAAIRLKLRRRALIVFLTELDDAVLADGFERAIGLIRRQHLVVAAMARPPGLGPLFEDAAAPASAAEVYTKLADHILFTRLRDFGKTLERQGVRFALLDSGRLSAQLAAAYLDVKRRQTL